MGLGDVFKRLDRRAGSFNRWFGSAALASNTRMTDPARTVDPAHVTAILGEIEKTETSREEREKA